ncbi:LysR family transcriptional regulator [Oryzibacter oryziterrae]|uniref:LysR family transcriptional regulator n=1 Tax=Oryzibacter oryziterrae TaxID=2766474 RepID=UPI0021084193|nr:LysR family transcriptional regulator [Oryzibacter oryziterrae]
MTSDDNGDFKSRISGSRLPSLSGLRCFEMAARTENFGKAADALHLTHGAISRAVRLLEEELGVALFDRRSRRVFLTAEGRRLAEAVQAGFGTIAEAAAALRSARHGNQITLSCEPTLLMRWLIPRLASFESDHPKVTLQLVAGGGPVRLGAGVDLAIRRADFPLPRDARSEPLFDERVGPVCRADLVERFFEVTSGGVALRRDAVPLHTRTRLQAWADWARAAGRTAPTGPGRQFDHFHLSLQAAQAGIGVAIGPWQMVRDEIASGILAAPCGFVADGSSYVLLSPDKPHAARAATHEALLSWLKSAAT